MRVEGDRVWPGEDKDVAGVGYGEDFTAPLELISAGGAEIERSISDEAA